MPKAAKEPVKTVLPASVDGGLAGRSQNHELLSDALLDILEECCLAGASPSRKEKAVVGPFNHPVGGSLHVVGAVEFCFRLTISFVL